MIQDAEYTHLVMAKLADLFLDAGINNPEGLDLLVEPQQDGTARLVFSTVDFRAEIHINNSYLPKK